MRPLTRWGRYKQERRRLLADYERACRKPVSVFAFGAKGDMVTDDTTAIQDAVDFVAKHGGGAVYVKSHLIGRPVTLHGEGGDKE